MVDKITSSIRPKIETVYFWYIRIYTDGITCGRKSRGGGDEKQLIDLERPYFWFGMALLG